MCKRQNLIIKNAITFSIMLLIITMLSGCVNDSSFGFSNGVTPRTRVADYSKIDCDRIWGITDQRAYENALYWLQLMNCSKNFPAKRAQAMLTENVGSEWAVLFKRSLLLARINGSDNEQRQTLDKMLKGYQKRSDSLDNVLNLWVKNQQLQLAVNAEKNRYQRLKESSESHSQSLNNELQSVKAKLQSLTNIETDILSNRKSANTEMVSMTNSYNEISNIVAEETPGDAVPNSQPKEDQNIAPNNNN